MKKLKDTILLLDDVILAAEGEDRLIESGSLKNKNGGDRFVLFHLRIIRESLLEIQKDLCQSP